MIENASKALLKFRSSECTYLGKNSFQYHKRLVRKNEIEKWPLRTSLRCHLSELEGLKAYIYLTNKKGNSTGLKGK